MCMNNVIAPPFCDAPQDTLKIIKQLLELAPGHVPCSSSIVKKYLLEVLLQDFPYYVQNGISHDNIWSTTPLTTEQLIQVLCYDCL